ncbi:MAG TPA: hypothetical protein VFV96_10605 [Verrucomicrobiae bacterium]|nr:hypothetical protein [Verrucomicrobiae bacterium]
MNMDNSASLIPENIPPQEHLARLRNALLALHKALVDSERVSYEKTVAPIPSPNHFLQLLTRDPWFAWLQPFSQLIVAMDETLEAKEPPTRKTAAALMQQAAGLLVAAENGNGFAGHYDAALQRDPDVVMAHAAVAQIINPRPTPPASPTTPR